MLPPFIVESCSKPEVNTKLKPMLTGARRLAVRSLRFTITQFELPHALLLKGDIGDLAIS
jgi:hypothetical protein